METLAGYQIMSKQTSPSISFLQAARRDLAAEYDGLNQPSTDAFARLVVETMARTTGLGPAASPVTERLRPLDVAAEKPNGARFRR